MFFGLDYNETSTFPTVSHGLGRFWDTGGTQWPFIQTSAGSASGSFTWTTLDSQLAAMLSNGVDEAIYTLARTPSFASTNPSDTTCS